MPLKTVSTFQPLVGETAGAASFLKISTGGIPTLERVAGAVNGVASTAYFLQFFSGTSAPSGGDKPLYELQVTGLTGFNFPFGTEGGLPFIDVTTLPQGAVGLVVYLSSSSGTFTSTAVTMDCEVTFDYYGGQTFGLTQSGDLTTGVNSRTVWADGSNPQNLYAFDAKNNSGSTQYIQLFAHSPISNEVPLMAWTATNGATISELFGCNGYSPLSIDSSGTTHKGCVLAVSTDKTKYVGPGGTGWNIRAFYKA